MSSVIKKTAPYTYLESVHSPNYPSADWLHNPDVSALSAVPRHHWIVDGSSVREMTAGEKDAAHLDDCKDAKIAEIDARTDELIALGFTFATKQFSLTLASQLKMVGTHEVKDSPALTYPLKWNTIDDADYHEIADAAELDAFYLTGLGTIRAHLDGGTALKDSVRAATTVAGVEAITDGR